MNLRVRMYQDIIADLIRAKEIIDCNYCSMNIIIELIESLEHDVLIYEDHIRCKYLTIKLKEIEMKLKLGFDLEHINNEIAADIKYWNNKIMEELNND